MKEAVGGTFMIYVLLIFLAVYITFLAVALNYAKAFRVKNSVIDIIEQNEGIDEFSDQNVKGDVINMIETRLRDYNYNVNLSSEIIDNYSDYICYDMGYCINRRSNNIGREYYGVITFVELSIPFINYSVTMPIKGETRVIERINE